MGGFRHLWSVSAPANASVIYGSFVDDFHVFIWSNTGKGYLYRLPTAVLKNAELDRSKSRPSLAFATDSSGSSGSSSDSILKQKKSSTVGGFVALGLVSGFWVFFFLSLFLSNVDSTALK
jgi:hypothetical protein